MRPYAWLNFFTNDLKDAVHGTTLQLLMDAQLDGNLYPPSTANMAHMRDSRSWWPSHPNYCLGCRLHSLYVTEHGTGKRRKGESRKACWPRREASCRLNANDGVGPGRNQYLRHVQRSSAGRSLKISGRCGGYTYRVWCELFWTAVL